MNLKSNDLKYYNIFKNKTSMVVVVGSQNTPFNPAAAAVGVPTAIIATVAGGLAAGPIGAGIVIS